jgi:hypothetical protein
LPQPTEDIQEPQVVYRRVLASYRDKKTGTIKPSAFKVRQGRKLSVFDPALCSPRDVLQNGIDVATLLASSDDPNTKAEGERQLRTLGHTVEEWVANGCTVVALPVSELSKRGFTLEEPEPNGHRNVSGDDFALYMDELAEAAVILSDEQCLTTDRSATQNRPLPEPDPSP